MIENGWRGADWPTSPAMNLSEVRESLRASRAVCLADSQRDKEAASLREIKRNAC